MKKYRVKSYNEGGEMESEQEIEVMNPDLMMAVKQVQAAVKATGMAFKDTGKRLTPEQEKYARERMSRR